MDFLEIKKEVFIPMLIADNKINKVREAVISNDYHTMFRSERLNYCSKEELLDIVQNKDKLSYVLDNYLLNDNIIDIVVEHYINDEQVISFIIRKYTNMLYPKHLEIMLKTIKYKKMILECKAELNKDCIIYLHSNNMLKKLGAEQVVMVVMNNLKDATAFDAVGDDMHFLPYMKKYSKEELDKVLSDIFNYDNPLDKDLYKKGLLDNLTGTQTLPNEVIEKVVMEWEYNIDEPWFEKLLLFQNLEHVLDYILENKELTDLSIVYIMNNKNTPKRILCRLYDRYGEIIVKASIQKDYPGKKKRIAFNSSSAIPVLDCHSHIY